MRIKSFSIEDGLEIDVLAARSTRMESRMGIKRSTLKDLERFICQGMEIMNACALLMVRRLRVAMSQVSPPLYL